MNAPVKIGDVLAGKYRVERVLGAGAMGIVVAARHLHLDERVAIKFLQPETFKDPNVIARFLREGRAAAKIRGEHVARVHDVGSLENGAPYLVMEYLAGTDLATLVKERGPLPVPSAAEYILQTCEAIAEAHALGIVHRDLKPSNLFITTRPDGSPAIKVIDFGISKITGGPADGVAMTTTTEVRGSPLFMSPEQMRSARAVDARSDLWAIGVSLYFLLTGAYPFYAESILELAALVLQSEPVPLRSRRPDLPTGLEGMIARCLRKNPLERYANVAELAAALGEFALPLARLSVDRIHRVLGVAPTQARDPLPSTPAIGMTPPAYGDVPIEARTERLPLPSTSTVVALAATQGTVPQGQTGASSLGSTGSPARKYSVIMVGALSFIGVVAAATIAWILHVSRDHTLDAPSNPTLPGIIIPSATPFPAPSIAEAPHAEVPPVTLLATAKPPASAPRAAPRPTASPAAERPSPAPPAALPQPAPTTTTPTALPTKKPPPKEIF